MPLQSFGKIVVEKSTKVETHLQQSDSTAEEAVDAEGPNNLLDPLQQQFYQIQQTAAAKSCATLAANKCKNLEYGTSNDVRHHQSNGCNNIGSSSNSSSCSQTQLPLMRRAQQRNSNNSHFNNNKCNNNTPTSGVGGVGATNTKTQQINVKQQQKQQTQMNKQQQQHQLIQHNTLNQQQIQQQQQSQQLLATQLQQQQQVQSKHQHVQKQQQLSQQMHTPQQQQQLYQHQPTQQQSQSHHQVIQVSEEFIEQATASGATTTTNMMISTTTGEVLNPQIFKIVATDGTTGNMIIDSSSATAVGGQSKVLLSNLTVLAKQSPTVSNTSNATATGVTAVGSQQQQHAIGVASNGGGGQQQPQTINYMSAKNLSYLTTAASVSNTGVGGGNGAAVSVGKTPKYTVTGTYKTSVKQHQQQQQQFTTTTYVHQTQQQTGGAQTTITQQGVQQTQQQQLYQKLSVPRQVQMLTRVQTVVQQQQQTAAVSAPTNAGQQPQQQQTQMLVQPVGGGGGTKYLSSSATTKSVSVTGGSGLGGMGIGIGGNMLKKSTNSLKISHGSGGKTVNTMQMQQQQGVKTTYITQQQQQLQPQYQLHQPQYQSGSGKIKTSKLLKQYNNVMNSNNNNSTGVNMLQQQTLGTYTISGGGHKLQQTTKLTKVGGSSSGKYAMNQQQQQLQHVANLPQGTHLHHKTMPHQQQQFSSGNNLVTLATSSNNNNSTVNLANNPGNNIKFVNSAHATVIQQHQVNTLPMQQQQTKLTLRQQQQQQIQFVDSPTTTIVKDSNSGNTIYQQQTQPTGSNNTTQSLLNDDIMIVNGTQMTDELSARILQSMAQKSFSNQRFQQQQQQQQHPKSIAMPPPTVQQTQHQQQQVVLQQHPSPTSVLLSPKEYPIYSAGQQLSTAAPTTITTQYTNAMQHQTPVSATAYLPISAGSAPYTTSNAIYATISNSTGSASTTIGRQTHSAPGSRTHSLDRNKSYEPSTTITRKSAVDYYKANSSNAVGGRGHLNHATQGASSAGLLSASTSHIPLEMQQQQTAQIIHLQTLKSSLAATTAAVAAGNSSYTIATNAGAATISSGSNTGVTAASNAIASGNADEEDIIGEEVRPTPVNTQDLRLRTLHAIQQDHTYANAMPAHLQHGGAENSKSGSGVGVNSQVMSKASGGVGGANNTQSQLQTVLSGNAGCSVAMGNSQQWSLGGIGATVASAGQVGLPIPPSSGQSTFTLHGQQIPRMQQDDDAHSAISNGSRVAIGDIDPGEETETAAEAEAEDDSVTRCICDLTHDDGYMICCDKCFVWQHVDCMGIDRQNIPDEYQCEVCQPRAVDKARARSLQLMKRREQTQLLLSAQSAHATGSSGAYLSSANSGGNYQLGDGHQRGGNASIMNSDGTMHVLPNSTTTYSTTKKGKVLKKTAKDTAGGKKSKKADKLAGNLGGKAGRKDGGGAKKTTKRKTKNNDGLSASASAAEKHAANLRQWIENYESAVTNHYSPELRARLHAITKQPSLLQSILNTENRTLKDCCNNGLEIRATTVPHAGGKILISNMDIAPSCPIFELRGKYMLSPQYKTQNSSVNMNSPPPSNYLAASLKAHKTPGPFIFFYQLPDAEAPMQTMNQDGSYPPLPPQPAYLKGPEICVDTRTYGNEARFVRRSCRPNAEIQHLFEKGTIHLFIVATTRIRASTEITIKHEPHDLLAIENKKATSSNCIVQPTSTACACGLIKDCLFGPPPTQQTFGGAGGKSSSRKSSLANTTVNGGVQLNSSAAAMQLTMGSLPPASGSGKKRGGTASQNINRNRSISSSGDSSSGVAALSGSSGIANNSPNVALPAAPLAIHAANLSSNTFKSNGGLTIISAHALTASAALLSNSGNMSATSSVSSVMHDSGICTSSSSPSVSIPSPSTLHIHSPTQHTQQQQQVQLQPMQAAQQPQTAQMLVPTAVPTLVQQRPNNTLLSQHSSQQQHQQILGALPTPLLLSPPPQLVQTQTLTQTQSQPQALQQSHQQEQAQHQQQQQQPVQQQQQHHKQMVQEQNLLQKQPQTTGEILSANNQNPPTFKVTATAELAPTSLIPSSSTPQQLPNISEQQSPREQQMHEQPQQTNQQQHCEFVGPPTISDASLAAAAALQSLNTAVTLTSVSKASGSPNKIVIANNVAISGTTEAKVKGALDVSDTEVLLPQQQQQHQQPQQQHQAQFYVPVTLQTRQLGTVDGITQSAMTQHQQQSGIVSPKMAPLTPTQTNTNLLISSPRAGSKSPQKPGGHTASIAATSTVLPHSNARNNKTSGGGKSSSSRSTSFSEDDHQQQQHNSSSGSLNDDSTGVGSSTSVPVSKEKQKLSREDRKMEAILRAIEKMERNQQRKSQQTKSGSTSHASTAAAKRRSSNTTSPTSPTKRAIGELGGGRVATGASARKKKRKTHKSYGGQSAQARRRRKSRMNSSNESADGAGVSGPSLPPPQTDNSHAIFDDPTSHVTINTNKVTNCLFLPKEAGELQTVIGPKHQLPVEQQQVQLTEVQQNQLSMQQSQLAPEQANQLQPVSTELPTESSELRVNSTTPASNEDQAAGLLLSFANADSKTSPTPTPTPISTPQSPQGNTSPVALQQYTAQQYYTLDQLKSPQHRTPTNGGANAASPPVTPISSACLLIEAAVGPLQDQMDGSSPNGDFKYPNKTKTKKVLMSNWLLNQVDSNSNGSVGTSLQPPPPPNVPTPPLLLHSGGGIDIASAVVSATNVTQIPPCTLPTTHSLDSLVQAATMCDYSKKQPQQHHVVTEVDARNVASMSNSATASLPIDEPQNLSMAALKVEEFIQQTERVSHAATAGVYNQTAIGGASSTGVSARNLLHLPLQVSTCSNNSSVKKRWLRQAISEETTTDEATTPTPNTVGAAPIACGLQNDSPTPATQPNATVAMLNVPNGFTTPLKKRRLVISDGAKEEDELGAGGGGSCVASPVSSSANCSYDSPVIGIVKTEYAMTEQNSARDAGLTAFNTAHVDSINSIGCNKNNKVNAMKIEPESSEEDEEEYDEDDEEYEERADVDVVGGVSVNETDTTTTAANTSDECMRDEEVAPKKEEETEQQAVIDDEDIKREAMLMDQDDDVDILRSPSPGHQQMLAAENNLVKIEPEDTSGNYDVKIDVEREESLAGDRFEEMVLMQVKKEEEEAESKSTATAVETETKPFVKEEQQQNFKRLLQSETDSHVDVNSKAEQGPKFKEMKKEDQLATDRKPIKKEIPINKVINSLSSATSSFVEDNDEEIPIRPTTSTSPLKLLTLDTTSNVSPLAEPMKKRPRLELVTSTPKENTTLTMDTQQTSLLKPLSARKLEMAKQSITTSSNKDTSIVSVATHKIDTDVNTVENCKLTKISTLIKPSKLNKSSTLTQPNSMTFLAAAAAAAIDRKPPPTTPTVTSPTVVGTTAKTNLSLPTESAESSNNSTMVLLPQPTQIAATKVDTSDADNSAGPLPTNNNGKNSTTSASSMLAPRKQNATNTNNSGNNERKAPLTDDDIQACLHSFHKENILILESRNNKKSKSNTTAAETQAVGNNSSDLIKNTKSSDNKSSSSSYTPSHHRHNDTGKNAGSAGSGSSKHSSSASKTLTNSNSSGTTKKVHKKERSNKEHTSCNSSNSRSSSTHSSGKQSVSSSSTSSKKLPSSHKKDNAASTKQSQSGSTTPASNSSKQHSSISSAGYNTANSSNGRSDSREREERRDKERHHHRHSTTSSSNSTSSAPNAPPQAVAPAQSTTPPNPPPPLASKKRQLNFEQELTKDLAIVNAALSSSSSRHRKDSGSARGDSRDDTINSTCSSSGGSTNLTAAARKRRESSSGGGGSRHRHSSSSSGGGSTELQKDTATTHKSTAAEHNGVLVAAAGAAAGSHHLSIPHAPTHVALAQLPPPSAYVTHFNNVVVSGAASPALMAAYFGGIGAVPGTNIDAASMVTPIATYVPTPTVALITSNSATQQHPPYSLLKTLPIQPALSHLASASVLVPQTQQSSLIAVSGSSALTPPISTPTVLNSGNSTPLAAAMAVGGFTNSTTSTYNSIYGKLRDSTPAIVPPPTTTPATLNAPAPTPVGPPTPTADVSANISLSEYLDTKVKSLSTSMGAFALHTSHAYATGGNANVSATKAIANNSMPNNNINSVNSSESVSNAVATATTLESSIVSKLTTPLKMLPLTRTASHDPRLNPQLNAPEPPPAPKRKLSINEYRKRMQLSSDSTTPDTLTTNSNSPTTPASAGANAMTSNSLNNSFAQAYNSIANASPEEMARQLSSSPTSIPLNKYTLNSPERKRRYSGSEKDHHLHKRLSSSSDDGTGVLSSSTGNSSGGNMSDTSPAALLHNDDEGKKGQFSAAPTLLEKQQEKLCERLKLLRNMNKSATSLTTATTEFGSFKKAKGKYIGAPCFSDFTCERLLVHVTCDKETKICGCEKNYPVQLGLTKGCAKPKKLGEQCFYDETCLYNDENSLCVQVRHNAMCQCVHGFHSVSHTKPTRRIFCTKDLKELNSDLPTLLGVTTGIAVLAGLICMVLHLFTKTKYPRPRNFGDANLPPPIMYSSETVQSGRPSSRSSLRSSASIGSYGNRRASSSGATGGGRHGGMDGISGIVGGGGGGSSSGGTKGILVSTSRTGSRRPSLASVHSTSSSVRSYSMMRFEKEAQQKEIRQEMKLRLARLQQQQHLNQNKPQIVIGDTLQHHMSAGSALSRLGAMPTPSPLTPNSTDELLPSVDELQEYPPKNEDLAIIIHRMAADSVAASTLTAIKQAAVGTSIALTTTTMGASVMPASAGTSGSGGLITPATPSDTAGAAAYIGPCSSSTEAL
ncbi:platelet binding protein GspB-like isoform X2 [Eurosta solidaginis]|uniref:platelet binding protein GspB-like isoform X2 n=1 Tax=Eurosta solidaginis TaxID=178769 RepID=UPI0035312173